MDGLVNVQLSQEVRFQKVCHIVYACGIILYKNGKAWVSILLIDKLHLPFSDYLTNHEKGRCNLSIALTCKRGGARPNQAYLVTIQLYTSNN